MRTVAVLTVSALAFGVAGALAAAKPSAPLLRLADLDPLVLAGHRFEPRERVRVTVRASGSRQVRVVRATRTGALVVRFTVGRVDPCDLTARALGSRGSRGTLKLPQRMCPPPLARP